MESKMEVKGNIYVAGVYGMRSKNSDSYLYIGSSGDKLNNALHRHLYYLKRGLYSNNKAILQEEYNNNNLVFEVIEECDNDISDEELSELEQEYIKVHRDSIINVQNTVKRHSSNKNKFSSYKRRMSNTGEKNPNNKYEERIIGEILYLRMNGYKPKEISEIISFYEDVDIGETYIPSLGISKWIQVNPIKPSFIDDIELKEAESIGVESTSRANVKAQNLFN